MKTLIYEQFSGVGLCNQLFSFETAIYLANITNRKLILLIKNQICHAGRAKWDYGYFLNYFTNDFLEYLPNGFEVYYKDVPKDIQDLMTNTEKTQKISWKARFSSNVFVDKELDTPENEEDIKKFCHHRNKEPILVHDYDNFENIYIYQSNASRCFYNFYTTEKNYALMRLICQSIKFKPFLYHMADDIYSKLHETRNTYNIFVHLRFGDCHKDQSFLQRWNNLFIKNLSEYFDGHKTNLINPKIYLLTDNKKNEKFFNAMKKYKPTNIETLTDNYINNYINQNKMIFYDFNHEGVNLDFATAIVEMILASKGNEFIGTSTSTFSHYIQYMRYMNNKSYYNYNNLSADNFKYCRYLKVNDSPYEWISQKFRGGHPVSWHQFWDINYKRTKQKPTLITIHGKTDGFGSQLQACLSLMAYCEYKGYQYVHTPMYKMHHNDDGVEDFPKYMNDFINIESKYNSINDISNYELSRVHKVKEGAFVHGTYYPDFFYNEKVLGMFREFYYSKPKPSIPTYVDSNCNIALHIRRGDVAGNNRHSSRFTSTDEYVNILKKLLPTIEKNVIIHIFSQGEESDFKNITDSFNNKSIIFHLNEEIQLTFHSLVKADYLIIAKSSFSYSAALFNENTVIGNTVSRWWHKPLKKWKIV
jgi:hypothetical protein